LHIDQIERDARKIATNLEDLLSKITARMREASSLTVATTAIHKNAVTNLSSTINATIDVSEKYLVSMQDLLKELDAVDDAFKAVKGLKRLLDEMDIPKP
jgi:hypothetical protein